MLFLSKDDYYEVYLKSLISDVDRETLTMLYQPIIGANAVSLYLSLYIEFKKNKNRINDSYQTHDDLVATMGLNISEIQSARRKLEAIGLMQTYYKEENKTSFYLYLLFAPKTPKEFFDDILFKGLLISKIGEKRVQSLMRKYKEKEFSLEGYSDITDGFKNVFNPNFDSNAFKDDSSISGFDRKAIDVSKGFDVSLFLRTIENSYGIIPNSIGLNDIKKISEIALLYGISEITFADLFSQSIKNNTIDYKQITELAIKEKDFNIIRNDKMSIPNDSSSKLGKKIQMMSTLSSYDYLKIKQNTGKVSDSDANLIMELSTDFGLNYSVINCLLDYCIERTGKLSKAYVTKIASSIRRENITSTLECMDYLKKSNRKATKKSGNTIETEKSKNTEEISDSQLDELLSGL